MFGVGFFFLSVKPNTLEEDDKNNKKRSSKNKNVRLGSASLLLRQYTLGWIELAMELGQRSLKIGIALEIFSNRRHTKMDSS
jgi:hypothetical protein